MRAPRERNDPYWDNVPPPGHSRCGAAKVAGYDVSQEDWDEIFGEKDWITRKAEEEDGQCVSVGGLITDVQVFDEDIRPFTSAELASVPRVRPNIRAIRRRLGVTDDDFALNPHIGWYEDGDDR